MSPKERSYSILERFIVRKPMRGWGVEAGTSLGSQSLAGLVDHTLDLRHSLMPMLETLKTQVQSVIDKASETLTAQ